MINKPPIITQLTAKAFPTEGEALNTKFQIKCHGASDPDMPLKYNIGYSELANPNSMDDCTPIEIGADDCQLSQATVLPSGPDDRGNNLTICIEVLDSAMSSSFFSSLLVRVKPRPIATTDVGKGSNLMNSIEGSAYTGNTRQMGAAAFPIISAINTMPSNSTEQILEKSNIRSQIVSLISKCVNSTDANATADLRLRDIAFQSKMLNAVTNAPEGELDNRTLLIAAQASQKMANGLLELSQKRSVSYDSVVASTNQILGTCNSIATNDTLSVLSAVANAIGNKMVTEEKRTQVSSGNMHIVVEKKQPGSLSNVQLKANGSSDCDGFKLGDNKDSSGRDLLTETDPNNPNVTMPSPTIITRILKSKSNVFGSAGSGSNMTSSAYSISMSTQNLTDYNISDLGPTSWIEMRLTNNLNTETDPPLYNYGRTSDAVIAMQTQKVTVDVNNALFVKVQRFYNMTSMSLNDTEPPYLGDYGFLVYFKDGALPTDNLFDHVCQLPLSKSKKCQPPSNTNNSQSNINSSATLEQQCYCHETSCVPLSAVSPSDASNWTLSDCLCNSSACTLLSVSSASHSTGDSCASATSSQPDQWTCFLSLDDINTRKAEKTVYFGIRAIKLDRDGKPARSNDNTDTSNPQSAKYQYLSIAFKSTTFSAGCFYLDTTTFAFSSSGMHVGQCSTPTLTQCFSNHMTSFMSSFYVPPVAINTADSAWLKLDSNPIAFSVVISLICFYFIVVIWVRRMDLDDLKKIGVTPLPDNHPADEFRYEITFWTGARRNAGTTAQVSFVLIGEESETEARPVFDPKRPVLQTGCVDSFYMTTPNYLGRLTHARIWHDNSGPNPKWYFSRMLVEDLQTGDKYFFISNRWFAFDEDDGMVDRIMPVSGMEEVRKFDVVFWSKAQKNLNDGHIWLSVVTRSPRSKFTRVQRATACLVLVMSTMMVNLMFYGQTKQVQSPQLIEFGPIKLTAHSIYLATVSSLIIVPINVIIVVLFKSRRNKPKKTKISSAKTDGPVRLETQANNSGKVEAKSVESTRDATVEEETKKSVFSKIISRLRLTIRRFWPLPWWTFYIAYVLSVLSVAACTYLMVEFGGVLGEQKTAEWLASMIVTLLQSIVLIQPIKIIAIAAVYALLIKKIDEEEDEVTKEMVAAGLPPMHERLSIKDLTDPRKRELFLKSKRSPPPPDEHVLRELREQRIRESHMNDILKDIVFYILFLIVLMMTAYTSQDYRSYLQNKYVKNMIIDGVFVPKGTQSAMTAAKAVRRDLVWKYLNDTVVPTAYPIACYNDQPCDQISRNWTSDPNIMLVRMVQLRQLRIKKTSKACRVSSYFINSIRECREEYSMWRDEETSFAPGWLSVNSTDLVQREWRYTNALDMYGTPVSGNLGSYAGGGYVASLGHTRSEGRATIEKLANNNWLDLYTRAVFVELLMYNPNTNLFTFCELLLEFFNGGTTMANPMIFTLRLNRYVGANGAFYIVLDILSLIFILVFLVKEIRALHKLKMRYFEDAFNVVDFLLLLVCCAEIGLFATRIVAQQAVSYWLKTYPNKFVNFQWLILWQQMNQLFTGLIVAIFNVRFLRLLAFNRKIQMLGTVLSKAAKPLVHFGIVFGIMFFAFMQMGYLLFFCNVDNFKTPVAAIKTLGVMTLNKFDFTNFIVGGGKLGMVFFFFYMLVVSFVLINFFLTIILETFKVVRAEWVSVRNDFEIVDYTVSCLRSAFGCKKEERLNHIDTRFSYLQDELDPQQTLTELDDKLDQFELYICTAGIRIEKEPEKGLQTKMRAERGIYAAD